MNQDDGSYQLSHIWDKILTDFRNWKSVLLIKTMPMADPVVFRSTKPITFDESIITGEVNGSLALWNVEPGAVGLIGWPKEMHQPWRELLLTTFFPELLL